jgi:hypothetical protein
LRPFDVAYLPATTIWNVFPAIVSDNRRGSLLGLGSTR